MENHQLFKVQPLIDGKLIFSQNSRSKLKIQPSATQLIVPKPRLLTQEAFDFSLEWVPHITIPEGPIHSIASR